PQRQARHRVRHRSVLFHSGEEHARLDAMDRKSITQRLRAARTRGDLRYYQKGYSSAYGVRYRQDVKVRGISRSSAETNARNEPARKLDTTVYAIIGLTPRASRFRKISPEQLREALSILTHSLLAHLG